MVQEFITISKSDPQFRTYLEGDFSQTQYAQPVQSLFVTQPQEQVTFKLISQPSFSWPIALSSWYSLERNFFLFFPILVSMSYLYHEKLEMDLSLMVSSILGLQFFLLALTLYNDYHDYIYGFDRVNENNHRKPLVMGFIRAYQARQLALVFFVLAIAVSSWCFWMKPLTLVFAFLASCAGLTLVIGQKWQFLRSWSLLATFLMVGPLLVVGFEFLFYDTVSTESIMLGLLLGLHALKYDYLKQMREIYYSTKVHISTFANRLGFEKSKRFYLLLSLAQIVVLVFWVRELGFGLLALLIPVTVIFEIFINRWVQTAPSFLSSQMTYAQSLHKLQFFSECGLMTFIFLSPIWLAWF